MKIGASTLAGIENDFMSVSSSYDDALKQYITKFFEEDSRKDFSDTPKGVRKKWSLRFDKTAKQMEKNQSSDLKSSKDFTKESE